MFEVFEKYLRGFADISEEEMALIHAAATIKQLRKWQSLLHNGEVWKNMCFICNGCFRLYRYDQNGVDHTMRFGVENWWMTDQESYNHEKPSQYNIEALAAGTIILWTKPQWDELLSAIPALKRFYEHLTARAYETSQQRIYSLISASAEERYLEFQHTYPKIFSKVPLHTVASYLGLSRETLSRVRRDFSKKK